MSLMIEARSPSWVIVVIGMVIRGSIWGSIYGGLVGALLGFPIFGIGAIFGLFAGCFVGILVGALSGLILGAITLLFFYPPDEQQSNRNFKVVTRISGAMSAGIFTFLILSRVFTATIELESTVFIYTKILPSASAVLLSQWIYPRVVRPYLQAQNVPV